MKQDNWMPILRGIMLVLVIGVSVFIYAVRDQVQEFSAYGYPGIFIIALLSNATVFLPAPGIAVVFAMGGVFHPLGVALAASTGGAIGEMSGYLAGLSGQAIVEKTDIYLRIQPWVDTWGAWAILIMAAIPNPFFDLAGIAAGTIKMPVWKFLLNCWIGQMIKVSFFAFAGSISIPLLFN